MATDTKLDSLVINYLSQAQYDNAKSKGTLNSNQIYMTPASSSTYTLPAATSSTLGGVKIGSNITVSSGTISLTKANVTSALGYTPPTTDTKYTLPTGNASTAGGVKLSDSTSSTSSTSGGIAATPAAVKAAIAEAKLAAWPIGSIYMSVNSTSPANHLVARGKEYLILSCLLLPAVIPQVALGANSPISLHKASYRIIRCLWPTEAT